MACLALNEFRFEPGDGLYPSENGRPIKAVRTSGSDPRRLSGVQFDNETGRWAKLGSAEDFRKSDERKEIIRFLIDADRAMSPSEIADALGKKRGAFEAPLGRMAKKFEVIPLVNGCYMAKES